jgi:glucose-1-phosphatase
MTVNNEPRIKAIFFDLGMVLVTFDWNIAISKFASGNQSNTERIQQFLAHARHEDFERNALTADEFYQFGLELTGCTQPLQEFKATWNEIFEEIPENVQLVRELARDYPLYVISNTNPWHAEYLEERYAWMNLFSQRFYSCDLGVRKPDPRIYQIATARAGVEPEHALFIDDRLENVQGAQAIGMQTILASNPEQLREDVHRRVASQHEPLSR